MSSLSLSLARAVPRSHLPHSVRSLLATRSLATAVPTSGSAAPPPPPPRRRPPVQAPVEPTTFSGKAAPRDVHKRPFLRGLPTVATPWEVERKRKHAEAVRAANAARAAADGPHGVANAAGNSPTGAYATGVSGGSPGRGQAKAPASTGGAASGGSGDDKMPPYQRREQESQTFGGPARPRAVYTRPTKDLPPLYKNLPFYLALAALGIGAWVGFVAYATNNERLASSVVRQVTFQMRNSPEVAALLGDRPRLAENWWGFGEPWISGGINLMQGRIDLKFRMGGSKQQGTVYFTSIRPQQAAAWRIVRYKLIADDGEVIRLEDKVVRGLNDE